MLLQLIHLVFRRVGMIVVRIEEEAKPLDAVDGMEDRNGAIYS